MIKGQTDSKAEGWNREDGRVLSGRRHHTYFYFSVRKCELTSTEGIELEVLVNSEWKPLISFSLSFASRVCLLIILKSRGKYL